MWNQLLPDYRFLWPHFLWLLIPAALLAALRGRRGGSPALPFPGLVLAREFARPRRNLPGWIVPSLFTLATMTGILSLARPQLIESHEKVKSEGVAIMGAIDVSRSMVDTFDFFVDGQRVNRLVVAKRYFTDFIKGRPNDRIGIVAFAGRAYLACPITMDHDWLLENMERVSHGLVEDATGVGSAIATAARHLDKEKTKSKIIVLLTDGANNVGSLTPEQAAKLAATIGIKVYCVAVGTPQGRMRGANKQEFGEDTLRQVAKITGGQYFHAQSSSSLSDVFGVINNMEKTEVESRIILDTKELFPWFLATSMGLFALWFLARQTFLRA